MYKRQRQGIAYLIQRGDGAILMEKRPAKGLLGGMDGLPTSPWQGERALPLAGAEDMGLEVRHTFTHFHLHLGLWRGAESLADEFPEARFVSDLASLALPTLFKKALKAASITL